MVYHLYVANFLYFLNLDKQMSIWVKNKNLQNFEILKTFHSDFAFGTFRFLSLIRAPCPLPKQSIPLLANLEIPQPLSAHACASIIDTGKVLTLVKKLSLRIFIFLLIIFLNQSKFFYLSYISYNIF